MGGLSGLWGMGVRLDVNEEFKLGGSCRGVGVQSGGMGVRVDVNEELNCENKKVGGGGGVMVNVNEELKLL